MGYEVVMTQLAKEQLDAFLRYLLLELQNEQAVSNLLEDALDLQESMTFVAGSLPLCQDPDLFQRGIRKISFTKHRYLWLYRIEGHTAYIMAMYHELQDYQNLFKKTVEAKQ